jgi:hypothetical protein
LGATPNVNGNGSVTIAYRASTIGFRSGSCWQ